MQAELLEARQTRWSQCQSYQHLVRARAAGALMCNGARSCGMACDSTVRPLIGQDEQADTRLSLRVVCR